MKILNIFVLITFFIIICVSLTKNFLISNNFGEESFENIDDSTKVDNTTNVDNKMEDERAECESKPLPLKEETITIPLTKLINHPASDTDKELKNQVVRPININISYDIEKKDNCNLACHREPKILPKPHPRPIPRCPENYGDYITGTVSNNFITTGYGSQTTLGSGPVRLEFTDEYTVPKREFVKSSKYQQLGNVFGSTDNAKIPLDIFIDEDENSYTILKDKYISFPQQRYSVTDLANMNMNNS